MKLPEQQEAGQWGGNLPLLPLVCKPSSIDKGSRWHPEELPYKEMKDMGKNNNSGKGDVQVTIYIYISLSIPKMEILK